MLGAGSDSGSLTEPERLKDELDASNTTQKVTLSTQVTNYTSLVLLVASWVIFCVLHAESDLVLRRKKVLVEACLTLHVLASTAAPTSHAIGRPYTSPVLCMLFVLARPFACHLQINGETVKSFVTAKQLIGWCIGAARRGVAWHSIAPQLQLKCGRVTLTSADAVPHSVC
jgi:hypothetical protein